MSTSIETVVEVCIQGIKKSFWMPEFADLAYNPSFEEEGGPRWLLPALVPFHLDIANPKWTLDDKVGPFGLESSYDAFAIMAGVRNHFFRPLVPITDRLRGLPENVSQETYQLAIQNNHDDEASWLTLAELQAYDWDRFVDRVTSDGHSYEGPIRDMPTVQRLRLVMERMATLGEPDKVRMVFWFT